VTGVRIADDGGVLGIAFTGPVLSRDRMRALRAALDSIASDLRPVVLSSDHPDIYLAGAHLAEIAALDAGAADGYAVAGRATLERIRAHPQPVVAAVHGLCAGGGFDLALACDAIVATSFARFSHPGVRRGLVTGWSGTATLRPAAAESAVRVAFVAAYELAPSALATVLCLTSNHHELASRAAGTALRLARSDRRRLMLWRQLRTGRSIDSLRGSVVLTEMVAADASSRRRGRR
jgi:enoyl-CoA hydratase/carnithine racemase